MSLERESEPATPPVVLPQCLELSDGSGWSITFVGKTPGEAGKWWNSTRALPSWQRVGVGQGMVFVGLQEWPRNRSCAEDGPLDLDQANRSRPDQEGPMGNRASCLCPSEAGH